LEARVYQINYYLRKLGLLPKSPGQSRLKDSLKQSLVGFFTKRNPDVKMDIVFSGIERMKAPFLNLQQVLKLIKR
jgi:hypothetical protein